MGPGREAGSGEREQADRESDRRGQGSRRRAATRLLPPGNLPDRKQEEDTFDVCQIVLENLSRIEGIAGVYPAAFGSP